MTRARFGIHNSSGREKPFAASLLLGRLARPSTCLALCTNHQKAAPQAHVACYVQLRCAHSTTRVVPNKQKELSQTNTSTTEECAKGSGLLAAQHTWGSILIEVITN